MLEILLVIIAFGLVVFVVVKGNVRFSPPGVRTNQTAETRNAGDDTQPLGQEGEMSMEENNLPVERSRENPPVSPETAQRAASDGFTAGDTKDDEPVYVDSLPEEGKAMEGTRRAVNMDIEKLLNNVNELQSEINEKLGRMENRLDSIQKQQKVLQEDIQTLKTSAVNDDPKRVYKNRKVHFLMGNMAVYLEDINNNTGASFELMFPGQENILIKRVSAPYRDHFSFQNATYYFNVFELGNKWAVVGVEDTQPFRHAQHEKPVEPGNDFHDDKGFHV